MDKKIYIIRHCKAEGQNAEAPLTETGFKQAKELSSLLADKKIERIISSPYLRAVQSIQHFAESKKIEIEMDQRLTERVLSTTPFSDWMKKLEATFKDMNLKYEGGESSKEGRERILKVVDDVLASDHGSTIIVAHGGIISLLLNYYDEAFGFKQWKSLSNPDVYELHFFDEEMRIVRLWE